MSKRTIFILLILVVGLAAVWGVDKLLSRRQAGERQALSIEVLYGIDPAQVQEIEIVKGEEKVALKHEGELWMAGDKEVDAEKIKAAFEAMKNAHFTGPVARAAENHGKLGVDAAGLNVDVRQDARSLIFIIGNNGPIYDSSYVRLEGEDEVYVADVNLALHLYPNADWWRKNVEGEEQTGEE